MLGLSSNLIKSAYRRGLAYVRDGLKLYMPYRGANHSEVKFVGTGSTSFDGDNDYIDIDTVVGDISSDTAGTISAWVKTVDVSETNERFIAFGDTTGTNTYMQIYNIAGVFRCDYTISGDAKWDTDTDSTVFTNNTWHHIAVVQNGTEAVLYVDGVAPAQTFIDTTDKTLWFAGLTNFDNGRLGCRNYGGGGNTLFMTGSLKNVAIWSRALTATEVQNVMYKTYDEVGGRLANGLVSWWALDVDYTDSTGTNDGTNDGSTLNADKYGGDTPVIPRAIDNAPTVQADGIGIGSVSLNGSSDYISVADAANLSFGDSSNDSAFSISAWVKMDNATSFTIISKGIYNSTAEWKLGLGSDDKLVLILYDESVADTYESARYDTVLTPYEGQWVHLAATYTGVGGTSANAGISLYIDGVSVSVTLDDNGSYDSMENLAADVHIGREASAYSDGNIAQLGIWSKALTQAQVQSVMEKTYDELNADDKTSLVSYWALDEAVLSDTIVVDKVNPSYSLGSDLVTNGGLGTDSDWTKETGWTITGGHAVVTNGAINNALYQSITTVVGELYKLTFTCDTFGDGSVGCYTTATANRGNILTGTGTSTLVFKATGTSHAIGAITLTANSDYTIDDVTCYQITSSGNLGVLR